MLEEELSHRAALPEDHRWMAIQSYDRPGVSWIVFTRAL